MDVHFGISYLENLCHHEFGEDGNNMTTRPGVFAAGDVITEPFTVVHAVEDAKKTARAMMEYI